MQVHKIHMGVDRQNAAIHTVKMHAYWLCVLNIFIAEFIFGTHLLNIITHGISKTTGTDDGITVQVLYRTVPATPKC